MKTYFLICLLSIVAISIQAQNPSKKNLIYVGLGKTLTANSVFGTRPAVLYGITYRRLLGTGKLSIEGTLSYINHYKREQASPFNYYYLSDQSQRAMLDMSLFVNVFKTPRHQIRVGIGPTVWYQKNGYARDETIYLEPGGNQVSSVTFVRTTAYQSAVGINLTGAYDFMLTPSLVIGLKGSLGGSIVSTNVEPASLNNSMTTAGIRLGYGF